MSDQEKTTFDAEDILNRRPTLLIRCLTVGAFYLSFAACLLALLLNGIVPAYAPSQFPTWLMQDVENNRIIILLIPLSCLFACYWMLRSITSDILARPERYLDERQKMLRDQVHRSAYKVLKGACLIVPAALLMFTIFWPNSMSLPQHIRPLSASTAYKPMISATSFELSPSRKWQIVVTSAGSTQSDQFPLTVTGSTQGEQVAIVHPTTYWQTIEAVPDQSISWLHSPENMGMFFGAFLLCLFLTISALPMTVLACKEKE